MDAMTGLTAKVEIGDKPIGYISGLDLTLDNNIVEILSFGDEWKDKAPTIKDWSATIDGTAAFTSASTQKDLWDAFNGNTPISISIYLDDTTHFKGNALVQSLNITSAPDDKTSISCELAGKSALVFTIPSA